MVAIVGSKEKVYHIEYDGYYNMINHDKQGNKLKRWFDNYKIDKDGRFANDYEYCIVEEVASTSKRGGKRYVCKIGEDGDKNTWYNREYVMDHTAPEPPMLSFAAKIKYVAPPPPSVEDIRREMEYRRMYDRNPLRSSFSDLVLNMDGSLALPTASDMLGEVEQQLYQTMRIPAVRIAPIPSNFFSYAGPPPRFEPSPPPPPPKHRRNV